MRHHYDLSESTRRTLAGNVPAIADAANVSDKYLYGVMAGTQTDPFAVFEHLYKSAVRSGVDTSAWDARLSEIRSEARTCDRRLAECLTEKLRLDANTAALIVSAIDDGEITDCERAQIQRAIERADRNREVLQAALTRREKATARVR